MRMANGYIMEHRLVMARWVGRPLWRTECVHHLDHNPRNNERGNLELWPSNQAHKLAEHGRFVNGAANRIVPDGLGTSLKPAYEPIIVARKPLISGTVAANVLAARGTGAINIDACRVETDWSTDPTARGWQGAAADSGEFGWKTGKAAGPHDGGRWPAKRRA